MSFYDEAIEKVSDRNKEKFRDCMQAQTDDGWDVGKN